MTSSRQPVSILMADDDEDDRELTREAVRDVRLASEMEFVSDGQDLLDYLRGQGSYATTQRPAMILLDLNMPRKDGREALAEIKADASLRTIPIVVMTTSSDDEDVRRSYALGANSFITKPVTHAQLVDVMQSVTDYWFGIVELPS